MSIYGKVGEQTQGTQNATHMSSVGEFYGIIHQTKVVQSTKKGLFAIAEATVAQVFDGDYTVGDFKCHMQQDGNHTLVAQFIANYTAAANGVSVGHKYSDDVTENNKIWEAKSEAIFGADTYNPETKTIEYVTENPMKGSVIHYKVVKDYKFVKGADGKKTSTHLMKNVTSADGTVTQEKVWFPKVIVLGCVDPADVSAEAKEQFKDKLHPAYLS